MARKPLCPTDVLYGVLKLPFTDASTALVPLLQAVCFLVFASASCGALAHLQLSGTSHMSLLMLLALSLRKPPPAPSPLASPFVGAWWWPCPKATQKLTVRVPPLRYVDGF